MVGPKFKEPEGAAFGLGAPVKLKAKDAMGSFYNYIRSSLRTAELTEFGRLLADPYRHNFQKAIKDYKPTASVERLAKKSILKKLENAGLTAFPPAILKRHRAAKTGALDAVVETRIREGFKAIQFDAEEIQLMIKVALGGGRSSPAIPEAANAATRLLYRWGELHGDQKLASLFKGLAQKQIVSIGYFYGTMLARGRQSLNTLMDAARASGKLNAEELNSLRMTLENCNGQVEEALAKFNVGHSDSGALIESEINSIKENMEELRKAEKSLRSARRSRTLGMRKPEKRTIRIDTLKDQISELEKSIEASMNNLKGINKGNKAAEIDAVYSLLKKAKTPASIEMELRRLHSVAHPEVVLEVFSAQFSATEKMVLSAYTMLTSRFPKLAEMTDAIKIAEYLRKVHPKWNKMLSFSGAARYIKKLLGGGRSWLNRRWFPGTRLDVRRLRWGLAAMGVAALGVWAYPSVKKGAGIAYDATGDFFSNMGKWIWQSVTKKPSEAKKMAIRYIKEIGLHKQYGRKHETLMKKMFDFMVKHPDFVDFCQMAGIKKKNSLEFLKKNYLAKTKKGQYNLFQFLKRLRLAINYPKGLPKDALSKVLIKETKDMAWDRRRADKIILLRDSGTIMTFLKQHKILLPKKQLAAELAKEKEEKATKALVILPHKLMPAKILKEKELRQEIFNVLYAFAPTEEPPKRRRGRKRKPAPAPLPMIKTAYLQSIVTKNHGGDEKKAIDAIHAGILSMIRRANQADKHKLNAAGITIKKTETTKGVEISWSRTKGATQKSFFTNLIIEIMSRPVKAGK
jgi:archaellum component FlaC